MDMKTMKAHLRMAVLGLRQVMPRNASCEEAAGRIRPHSLPAQTETVICGLPKGQFVFEVGFARTCATPQLVCGASWLK